MSIPVDDPQGDGWIHAVFAILRDEAIALSDDFGGRVKGELDVLAASHGIRPPSAVALLAEVAIESGSFVRGLVLRGDATPVAAPSPSATKPDPKDT